MKLLLTLLILASTANAEAVRIRVKVLNTCGVSDGFIGAVIGSIKVRFRSDLRVRTRFGVRTVDYVGNEVTALAERFNLFRAYALHLRRRPRWNRVTFVAVCPSWEAGHMYWWGLSSFFSMGVIYPMNNFGEDRFDFSWIVMAHEIAHRLGASHIDEVPNVMHSNALAYADEDLRFLKRTRKELNL